MSKHDDGNPVHYKVRGRLQPSDDSKQKQAKGQASIAEHERQQESRNKGKNED